MLSNKVLFVSLGKLKEKYAWKEIIKLTELPSLALLAVVVFTTGEEQISDRRYRWESEENDDEAKQEEAKDDSEDNEDTNQEEQEVQQDDADENGEEQDESNDKSDDTEEKQE